MESTTIDESVLTGLGHITAIDDKTITWSPAPVANSTMTRERWIKSGARFSQEVAGSCFADISVTSEGGGRPDDESVSLGLLPAYCLLDVGNDLLHQDSFRSKGPSQTDMPATGTSTSADSSHITQASGRNQLQDTGSSQEHTSDSNELMTTVKKCPQRSVSGRSGSKYHPQALFQSVEEVNESRLDTTVNNPDDAELQGSGNPCREAEPQRDSGSAGGQIIWPSDQKSECNQATTGQVQNLFWGAGGCHRGFPSNNDDDEADVPMVELDQADMAELQECMPDIDTSDEDEASPDDDDNNNVQLRELSVPTDLKEESMETEGPAREIHSFLRMDGLFKVPLPPTKLSTPVVFRSNTGSAYHQSSSMLHGDSVQTHQSESVVDWGPSIEFGSTTNFAETSDFGGASQAAEKFCPSVSVFDEVSSDLDRCDQQSSCNPFDNCGAEAFGDEEFITDKDAVAAMMAEDEQQYMKDNLVSHENENFNSTMESVRGEDQTFQNMTIGTYMAVGSAEVGSWLSAENRPEFGMPVKSPVVRGAGHLLRSNEESMSLELSNGGPMFEITNMPQDDSGCRLSTGSDSLMSHSAQPKNGSSQIIPQNDIHTQSPQQNHDPACHPGPPQLNPANGSTVIRSDCNTPEAALLEFSEALAKMSLANWSKVTSVSEENSQPSIGTGNQRAAFQTASQESAVNHCDGTSPVSVSLLEDDLMNSTDFSMNSILKQFERSDISFLDPAQFILSAYNKKVQQKRELKHADNKTSTENQPMRGPSSDVKVAKSVQFQDCLKTSIKDMSFQQRGMDANEMLKSQANIVVLKSDVGMSKSQGDSANEKPASGGTSVASLEIQQANIKRNASQPKIPNMQAKGNFLVMEASLIGKDMTDNQDFEMPQKDLSRLNTQAGKNLGRSVLEVPQKDLLKQGSDMQIGRDADKRSVFELPQNLFRPMPDTQTGRQSGPEVPQKDSLKQVSNKQIGADMEKRSVSALPQKDFSKLMADAQTGRDIGKQSVLESLQKHLLKPVSDTQTSRDTVMQVSHKAVNQTLPKPETRLHPRPGQAGVTAQMEPDRIRSRPDNSFSHNSHKRSGSQTNAESFKALSHSSNGHVSSQDTLRTATKENFIKPSQSTFLHKDRSIEQRQLTQCFGYNYQNSAPSHELHDSTVDRDQSVNETLESVTINSRYTVLEDAPVPDNAESQPKTSQEPINPHSSFTSTQKNHITVHSSILDATVDASSSGKDDFSTTQFHSLIHDCTSSLLHNTVMMQDGFVSSTPLMGHQPNIKRFASEAHMTEKSILPAITPKQALNILEVPEAIHFSDVCCVQLSLQTMIPVKNLLDKGVKCQFSYREVTFQGHKLPSSLSPFEMVRQVILAPDSLDTVQVMFRPRDQGAFGVDVEIMAQSLINPHISRTYIIHVTAAAEFPSLMICPANDKLDFGELLWGGTSCRSIKVQNVGRATVPLRFSISRAESALCNFSFYNENRPDVSTISQSTRPPAAGSVYSVTLSGKKEGQPILIHTVSVYCLAKELQKHVKAYTEDAERFQATLSVDLDMPVQSSRSLNDIELFATVGMYKLHVDHDVVNILSGAGYSGQGTVKIINSGNICMHVDLSLEPQRDCFSLSTDHVVVPAGGNCPVQVTYSPQLVGERQDDNRVNLMLQNQLTQHYVSVIGKLKTALTKINGSVPAIHFGGVNLMQSIKKRFTFIPSNDDDVLITIKNAGSSFKLQMEGEEAIESKQLSVMKGQKYSIWVTFSPTEVTGYLADLTLQVIYGHRYTIPLSGYGGCSNLVIDKVNRSQTGDLCLDIGCLVPDTSIFQKITIRNSGTRCCFVKATFYDVSRQEFQASVLPSSLILPASEATDVMIIFNPTQKEADLCSSGRALVAFIKFVWADEIARQHFISNPGEQKRQHVSNFDIPVTATQREIINAELKTVTRYPAESYSFLKKAISSVKIGLYGHPAESQTSQAAVASRSEPGLNRSLRPALTSVSPNIRPVVRRKEDWTLSPLELQLTEESQGKDFIQVLNFSTNDLRFVVECDEGITVTPAEGLVKPKNTALLTVSGDLAYFTKRELKARCGLVRIRCLQQMKYVKVYIPANSSKTSSPRTVKPSPPPGRHSPPTPDVSPAPSLLPPAAHSTSDHPGIVLLRPTSRTPGHDSAGSSSEREDRKIQALEMFSAASLAPPSVHLTSDHPGMMQPQLLPRTSVGKPGHDSAETSPGQEEGAEKRVQASDMAMFPATEAGATSGKFK